MDLVLEARDKRVELIESSLNKKQVVISLRVNYPGLNKDNRTTQRIIETMHHEIESLFPIEERYFLNNGEGPIYIYLLKEIDAFKVKRKTISLEEEHPLGRLIDCDVYFETIRSISRKELGFKGRRCMICDCDAFICIRNKTHSNEEIIGHIKRTVKAYERN